MKRLAALGLLILALAACTDSGDYLFNDQGNQEISVFAITTASFDEDAKKSKSDTIQPGDSLIFWTTVYPSKSIRSRQYFWTLDGSPFASEYSFKKSIDIPGIHKVAFVFVDYFGDTLSDTLTITVATPPIIDIEHFIPANGTQNIAPDTAINFAWNAIDPDSLWSLSSHFILKNSEKKVLVDTILQQAHFTYLKGLSPLQKYTWSVTAYNEFNQRSNETLTSTFFTNGINDESAISGTIKTSAGQGTFNYRFTLLNEYQDTVKTIDVSGANATDFNISPLPEGSYTLIAWTEKESDFTAEEISVNLNANQVLAMDSIILYDYQPPRIKTPSNRDTIRIADTLLFLIEDLGGDLSESKINIRFENETIEDFKLSNDSLYVPFTKYASVQSWSYKLITISATDASYNKGRKTFYLRPNTTLPEVFSE